MREHSSAPLRVAVISESESQRVNLKQILETNGLCVVADRSLSECYPGQLGRDVADVLLIDLDESFENELNCLDLLIEQSSLPILFNDGDLSYVSLGQSGDDWGRKLVTKLNALVQCSPNPAPPAASKTSAAAPRLAPVPTAEPIEDASIRESSVLDPLEDLDIELEVEPRRQPLRIVQPVVWPADDKASRVWVLGASIGGPQALKAFFAALPSYLPIAFVIAQHIGVNFVRLLAEQLDRNAGFSVLAAEEGKVLQHQQAMVVPVDQRCLIDSDGRVIFEQKARVTTYSPCIDDVMTDFADRYGNQSGAIVFSGMGDDGMIGVRAIAEKGGPVWAQDMESCVISSMPDHARRTGVVTFSGTPAQLADRLVKQLQV